MSSCTQEELLENCFEDLCLGVVYFWLLFISLLLRRLVFQLSASWSEGKFTGMQMQILFKFFSQECEVSYPQPHEEFTFIINLDATWSLLGEESLKVKRSL